MLPAFTFRKSCSIETFSFEKLESWSAVIFSVLCCLAGKFLLGVFAECRHPKRTKNPYQLSEQFDHLVINCSIFLVSEFVAGSGGQYPFTYFFV